MLLVRPACSRVACHAKKPSDVDDPLRASTRRLIARVARVHDRLKSVATDKKRSLEQHRVQSVIQLSHALIAALDQMRSAETELVVELFESAVPEVPHQDKSYDADDEADEV